MIGSFDIKIIRSKRRSLSLSVERNGSVTVRAPFARSTSAINAFVNKNSVWIEKQRAIRLEAAKKARPLTERQISKLKEEALVIMPEKVEKYADILGLKYNGVKITGAKTRWGSCSGKNSICFSYRVMLLDDYLRDYVALHEVCHIKEKNHSKKFYRLIQSVMPDFRRRESEIKKFPGYDLY